LRNMSLPYLQWVLIFCSTAVLTHTSFTFSGFFSSASPRLT
jgi:hypothetical protein